MISPHVDARCVRWLKQRACFQSLAGSNVRDVYDFKEFLAAGQYGKVYRVRHRRTKKDFACKEIDIADAVTEGEFVLDQLAREVEILHTVSGHPNVCNLIEAYEDGEIVHLVLDLCSGGDLTSALLQQGRPTRSRNISLERKSLEVIRGLVSAVAHCHSLGVVHRDIKLARQLGFCEQAH